MKVLVTGNKGFIGKNLLSFLSEVANLEIITFDVDDDFNDIVESIGEIDFIFHLAGSNRPIDPKEFYETNTDLTKRLVDLVKKSGKDIPFVFASSIQAELDNDYGKSKKMAEDYILDNLPSSYVYRFHNVFGKWCKPNYNSVVATFCNNIANGEEITISDRDKELELIYIDDIIYEFLKLLEGNKPSKIIGDRCFINPCYKISLGNLAEKILFFKKCTDTIFIPNTGDEFTKKLYSTYISYVPVERTNLCTKMNIDQRGSFTELIRSLDSGQISVSVSNPGVVRGNHYHHTKIERFIVVKGKAKISFSSVVNDDSYNFEVSDKKIEVVTIPVGYTHKIENIGDDEMILVIWCNELYDEKRPDTYYKEVKDTRRLIKK